MVSNLWSGKIPYICANGNNPAFLEDFGKTPEYGSSDGCGHSIASHTNY